MESIMFLILDLRSFGENGMGGSLSVECHLELKKNILNGVKEFSNLIVASQNDLGGVMSGFVQLGVMVLTESSQIEVPFAVQPLTGVELKKLHQKLDMIAHDVTMVGTSTSESLVPQVDLGVEALAKVVVLHQKRKKQLASNGLSLSTQVGYISPWCFGCSEKSTQVLSGLSRENIKLTYAYVPLLNVAMELGELNLHLANFAAMIREYATCSLVRVDNSMLCFRKMFMTWGMKCGCFSKSMAQVSLVLSDSATPLVCDTISPIATFMDMRKTQICKCHQVEINKGSGRNNCSITTLTLGRNDTRDAVAIGTTTLQIDVNENARYETVALLNCRTLDESLIFGEAIMLSPTKDDTLDLEFLESNQNLFFALIHSLHEKDVAMLLRQQVASTNSADLYRYFVLIPGSAGSALLKRVAANEELASVRPISATEKVTPEAVEVIAQHLQNFAVTDYNPLNYHTGFHEIIQQSITRKVAESNSSDKASAVPRSSSSITTKVRDPTARSKQIQNLVASYKKTVRNQRK